MMMGSVTKVTAKRIVQLGYLVSFDYLSDIKFYLLISLVQLNYSTDAEIVYDSLFVIRHSFILIQSPPHSFRMLILVLESIHSLMLHHPVSLLVEQRYLLPSLSSYHYE